MIKYILYILLLFLFSCTQGRKMLYYDINFVDREVTDTSFLFEMKSLLQDKYSSDNLYLFEVNKLHSQISAIYFVTKKDDIDTLQKIMRYNTSILYHSTNELQLCSFSYAGKTR